MAKKKTKVLRAFKPNSGIRVWYRKQLIRIIEEINADIQNEILKSYKNEQIAMDGISDWLGHAMDLLADRWDKKLSGLSGKVARMFVSKSKDNFDRQFTKALRDHGFTVNLQMSERVREAVQADIGYNVSLIKSIGSQYLEKVQLHAWESVANGMDAGQLSQNIRPLLKNLQHDFKAATRRANLIARDQTNKANANIEQARREELGITEAIWRHSGGAKEPRHSHVMANGKRFDIKTGLLIDGEYTKPGQKINCGCTSQAVLPWEMQGVIEMRKAA